MQKVSLYVRQRGTRAYQPADPKGNYPMGMIFVLRYVRDGKRCWETLTGFQTYQSAKATAMRREIDFFTGEQNDPPKPEPVAIKPKPVVGPGLTLDMAIDRYVENVKTKSARTAHGYSYTLKQFYQSCRSKTLSEVTKQDLYDFIGYLRREGLGDRTVHNRVGEVVTFLRHFGV